MKVLAIILFILFLILLLKVGVTAEYSEDGILLLVHAGPLKIKVLPKSDKPKKEKPKKEKKPKEKKPKEKKPEEEQPKKGGSLSLILDLIPEVTKMLSNFTHKLSIDVLTVHFTSAASDPFKAAMAYGYSSAAMGLVIPFFEKHFILKKRDLTSSVDFTETEPKIYIKAKTTISLLEIFAVVFSFGFGALKVIIRNKCNNRKAEK